MDKRNQTYPSCFRRPKKDETRDVAIVASKIIFLVQLLASRPTHSIIQIGYTQRIFLNELPPRFHQIAHQS